MKITNLKDTFIKNLSKVGFRKKFTNTIGVYFDEDNIFCVNLKLTVSEDSHLEHWQIINAFEMPTFMSIQLVKTDSNSIKKFKFSEDNNPHSAENIHEVIAEKVNSICKMKNWNVNTIALCLDSEYVVTAIEDFSSIPKDKIQNAVNYQISAIGNFELDSFYASFMEISSELWMEGISKAEVSKWIQAFQKYQISVLALTAIPDRLSQSDLINYIENNDKIDLSNIDLEFLNNGGLKAIFAAKNLIYQKKPNFLFERAKKLNGWNFNKITAAMMLTTVIILILIGLVDFWSYRQAKSNFESENQQLAFLESSRRKKEIIEKDLIALKEKNQIMLTLSKNSFPCRGLLIHLGTLKIKGVWLREIRILENKSVEIKGEAMTYELMANYVKKLENDREIFKKVSIINSEVKNNLVQFTIQLSF